MSTRKPDSNSGSGGVRVLQMCAVDFTARQFLLPLSAALDNEGYTVQISCARGPWFPEMEARGFHLIDNPVARNANIISHIKSVWKTMRLLRAHKITVLHVHTPVAALVGRIAARIAGTPLVLYTAHGFYFHQNSRPWVKRALICLEKLGAACGDYILTVSDEDRASAIKYGIARPANIETIYNGVDTDHYDPARFSPDDRAQFRAQFGIPANALVIGIMGRLVREKGFYEFFDAARAVLNSHPDTWFMVVGDLLPSDYDGKRDEMRSYIQQLGIGHRIVFTGMVDDPAPPLNAMDIFCLPSYREGMPISLMEAMSMALPCIATDIRGCREEVVHEHTGFLVPVKEAAPLASRMIELLEDADLRATYGQAGRQRVLHQFDIRNVVAHQVSIYKKLLRAKGLIK